MRAAESLERQGSQAELAELIGVSEGRVSQIMSDGIVERGLTLSVQLRQYCEWLREVAAGRQSMEVGGLDLVQERAALAREQRHGIELKNAVARGEFAPIALLSEVLATASTDAMGYARFDAGLALGKGTLQTLVDELGTKTQQAAERLAEERTPQTVLSLLQ